MKIDKKLLQKQEKIPRVKVGYPSPKDGSDGDMQIRAVPNKGLFLFYKYGNNWYGSRMVKSSEIKNPREESRIIINPNNFNTTEGEIYKSGDDIKIKIDSDNSHTLGKSSTKITRNVEDGNPTWQIGASDTDGFFIQSNYGSGSKGIENVKFTTKAGTGLHLGKMVFEVDEIEKLEIDDLGLNVTGDLSTSSSITSGTTLNGEGIILTGDSGADCSITMRADAHEDANDSWKIIAADGGTLSIGNDAASADTFVTQIELIPNATVLDSQVNVKGDFSVPNGGGAVGAAGKIFLDGGNDTFIYEYAADTVQHTVGGDVILTLAENGTYGNTVNLLGSTGFARGTTTYSDNTITSSGGTDDTDVDFRFSNKQYLELTGNVTNLNFVFPTTVSGNYLLLLKQDGSTRTVTDYKSYAGASDGSPADLLWAGGSEPTLTAGGNKTDIISIFWDATGSKAYATISLNF